MCDDDGDGHRLVRGEADASNHAGDKRSTELMDLRCFGRSSGEFVGLRGCHDVGETGAVGFAYFDAHRRTEIVGDAANETLKVSTFEGAVGGVRLALQEYVETTGLINGDLDQWHEDRHPADGPLVASGRGRCLKDTHRPITST